MGLFSSIGNIFSGGNGGGLINGIITGADLLTGGWASDQMSKSSAKRQFNYNSKLQQQNIDFQKYLAENAHQLEMADLQKAGLNPALTATGSSAGSIAGGSASQGTSGGQIADLSGIINSINSTRMTNAQVDSLKKNADANMINANANMTNAKTNRTKMRGSKEGAIGNIAEKGMSGTWQAVKDWFLK